MALLLFEFRFLLSAALLSTGTKPCFPAPRPGPFFIASERLAYVACPRSSLFPLQELAVDSRFFLRKSKTQRRCGKVRYGTVRVNGSPGPSQRPLNSLSIYSSNISLKTTDISTMTGTQNQEVGAAAQAQRKLK